MAAMTGCLLLYCHFLADLLTHEPLWLPQAIAICPLGLLSLPEDSKYRISLNRRRAPKSSLVQIVAHLLLATDEIVASLE